MKHLEEVVVRLSLAGSATVSPAEEAQIWK